MLYQLHSHSFQIKADKQKKGDSGEIWWHTYQEYKTGVGGHRCFSASAALPLVGCKKQNDGWARSLRLLPAPIA